MKLMPPSTARWTSASTSACGSPPITSHICPTPPNVIAPRHSSDTNTPVSASCRYFIDVVYSVLPDAIEAAPTHGHRARAAVRDVPDHLRRSREHRDRRRLDPAGAAAVEHA